MSVTSLAALAAIIDHTILRPDATEADVENFCAEALQWNFASVCVNPLHVPRVAVLLRGSAVRTGSVVGFPLGATPTELKRRELEWVLAEGAAEVDMVISIGTLKSVGAGPIGDEVATLKTACGSVPLKVILETSLLTDDEIVAASLAAKRAGADFVKTSTAFTQKGATVETVALMRRTVGPEMGVKASGGIRSFAEAMAMIEAGANRIGTSRGVALMREAHF
ncbi:deoxyribose-phosphate aldolase [Pleomorphomonas diazotrophica]|uniref:Deoxyribose-phosphate aldolase n=1 Tax=Pleomorphomonas diazotrophica TaxID=1166257 RepID=A0A1I4WNU8_9HYPH|nr:deoxyribose-phosphate aldolase [Pleomorphomonas diazotrophica]PKR87215.1 deoxyribose-phosphate aldolase [Pleomorphomonas diazotrophica]SFN15195.1 deoxyribose-phosphate aldolase [Pleomorphomonas diazotrophica]